MSHPVDRLILNGLVDGGMLPVDGTGASTPLGNGVHKRIDFLASHMLQQYKEFEAAEERTARQFAQLLQQLEETVVSFQQSFLARELPISNVYARIDGDRSVGILHLMWHTISFIMRCNTKPMALRRNGREPMFTGRIIAVMGDYTRNTLTSMAIEDTDFGHVLDDELASLYIPAVPTQPAVMKFSHQSDEMFFHPAEATQQFLLKVLEAVCSGGYFHESQSA